MLDKTIQYTFIDWNISWIKFLEFTKWELIGFSIPKKLFNKDIFNINYLKNFIKNSWIYFLIWDEIYIWQAIDLFTRLEGHIRKWEKEFTNLIIFTTTNNSFDEWDINFLEKNIIEITKNIWNNTLTNITNWNKTNIKEFRKSDLIVYIEEIKFLLKVLWYDFMEDKVKKEDLDKNKNIYFLDKPWVSARMIYNENWYIILRWSIWKKINKPSLRGTYKNLKQELIDKWFIEVKWEIIEFTKDTDFTSPTWPAQILLGYSVSWPDYWKNKDWKTLKEVDLQNNLN